MPSCRSSLPQARSQAASTSGSSPRPHPHLQPVQGELGPGEGERRERGDLVGPPKRGIEVAEALDEAERVGSSPLQVSAPRSIARAGPARRGATAAGSTSGRPASRAWRRDAEPCRGRRHPQVTGDRQLGAQPRAAPSTAARCGRGSSRSVASTSRSRSVNPASSTPERSAPAQKCPPAPVITTTRARIGPAWASRSWSRASWSRALRRSARSMVSSATGPRSSRWITGRT